MVCDLAHVPASDVPAFLPVGAEVSFSFGLVRDPYDRFVSAFRHLRAHGRCSRHLTPERFIERCIDHTTLRADWRLVHFRPQYSFFFRAGECLVDFIGRYEAFDSTLEILNERLGRRLSTDVLNVGTGDGVVLTDRVVAGINHYYARDFALFGYPLKALQDGARCASNGMRFYEAYESLWPEERGLDATLKVRV
jgi:hypothetical protein